VRRRWLGCGLVAAVVLLGASVATVAVVADSARGPRSVGAPSRPTRIPGTSRWRRPRPDGTIDGMLPVNATTGQVWYHTWHGRFIA
jgi:hypothetical protein